MEMPIQVVLFQSLTQTLGVLSSQVDSPTSSMYSLPGRIARPLSNFGGSRIFHTYQQVETTIQW